MIARRTVISVILVAAMLTLRTSARAQMDSLAIDKPFEIGNLTVFFLSSLKPAVNKPPYLTLSDALRNKRAVLHNMNSQTLWIENKSDTALFIQSGDMIKGGQQDRLLRYDMVIAAKATDNDVTALCIEHGRSTQRDTTEPLEYFTSSDHMAPLHHMRVTPKNDLTRRLMTPRLPASDVRTAPDDDMMAMMQEVGGDALSFSDSRSLLHEAIQESVWHDVEVVQSKLQVAVKDSVRSKKSPTSLELTMESDKVQRSLSKTVAKLLDKLGDRPNAIGIAYSVNGELMGAEIYRDPLLFKSLAPKVFDATAAEALMSPTNANTPPNATRDDVEDMLAIGEHGHFTVKDVNARTKVGVVESPQFYLFETADTIHAGIPLHRSFLRK